MQDALVGRVIASKFAIEAPIGSGAMGVVYRARHLGLDKCVAVKVLHQSVARDPTAAARLRREAFAASRLDHPNSVHIVDFGEEPDGLLYIAMELLDGLDLLQVMERDWPLTPERTVDLLSQTLSALAMAHEQGIVHRDLKPENIMVVSLLDDDGRPHDRVKVCDFGIAKVADASDDQQRRPGGRAITTQNTIIGTPEYMSPEQCRGEPIDARSDLYAVGVVLYQLLVGRVPFYSTSALDVLLKHLSEEPAPPTQMRPDVPPALEAVCMKALRKRPSERYGSAREMRAELRAAVDGLEATKRHPAIARPALPGIRSAETLSSMDAPKLSSGPPAPTARDADRALARSMVPSAKGAAHRLRRAGLLAIALAFLGAATIIRPWRAPAAVPPTVVRVEAFTTATATAEPTPLPPERPGEEARQPDPQATARAASTTAPHRARSSATPPPVAGTAAPTAALTTAEPRSQALAYAAAPAAASSLAVVSAKPNDVEPPVAASTRGDAPERYDGARAPESPGPGSRGAVRHGRVSWSVTAAGGGATTGTVAHALARASAAWQRCYEAGLSTSPAVAEGSGIMRLLCDEQGRIVSAALSGFDLGDVASCIRASTSGVTVPNADTGDAWASVALTFKVLE